MVKEGLIVIQLFFSVLSHAAKASELGLTIVEWGIAKSNPCAMSKMRQHLKRFAWKVLVLHGKKRANRL